MYKLSDEQIIFLAMMIDEISSSWKRSRLHMLKIQRNGMYTNADKIVLNRLRTRYIDKTECYRIRKNKTK